MTCEFLSGLTQLPFPSSSIVVGAGNITTAGTLYFFLSGRNRAGWTIASAPIAITYPANSSIAITLPPGARALGTDFIYYSLSAGSTNNPIASYQIAQWDNYQADQYSRRILNPIVLDLGEHISPAGSVAIPADLPTGTALKNGMHRLIIGGIPNGATSSYYKYSQYSTATASLEFVLEPHPGEKWVRTPNPYTGQIINAYGTGGCANDVRSIDTNYVIPPPPYDPVQSNPVKGASPIKLTWHNDSTIALKAGTNFGLDVRQGNENRTDAFNGKLILTLKGYTDGLGGLDRLDAGGINTMPNVDVDRVWGYTDDAIGILTLDKDLPPGESVVYEIAPYFTAQQFQGQLAPNELISTYIYPYTQSGKNVASLWAITGDLVLAVAERMHVVPLLGAGARVNCGSAIVKAYTFTQVPDRDIFGLTPNTPNQKITIDGNGICANRINPLESEAIRAIVSTESGRAKLGTYSANINITNGKATLTLTYPGYAGDGKCAIRSDYPTIGGDLGELNPPFVRIFAYDGTNYYPALSSGAQIGLVPGTTQTIAIDSLGGAIPSPTNPTDPLFGLFSPPTIAGTPTTGGTIPSGTYQFCAAYDYDGSTVSSIDHGDPSCIQESELTIADLFLLNQGWGRPIYNLADLRSIPRSDTFAWQHRSVTGGLLFYYDPDSTAVDDAISTFRPAHLTTLEPGRWLIRKSYSITPVGAWNNTTTYNYLDLVTVSNDGSYLYINPTPSSGNLLTNTTYWQQTSFRGAQGLQGVPGSTGTTTTGTNPNLPALGASDTYTVASTANLSVNQYYGFSGIAGTLKITALPSATTATLENTDSVPGAIVTAGTKLLATGKTGDTGQTGAAGTTSAVTVSTNPNIPALNASATYTVATTIGLAIGQYYGFASIGGTLEATALTATTVTLKNIDSVAGVAIPANTRINLSGRRGATGASGSPHVARHAYNSGATYNKFEEVDFGGASYYWSNTTPGNTSPPSSDWQLIADRGATGATGIAGAITVGTQPNISALGANDTYTVDTTLNLLPNQYYGFSGIAGSLLVVSTPTATTVVLQNTDVTPGTAVAAGIKLLACGKTGNQGIQGNPGTAGALTTGTNPNIPALNASANYSIDSVAGIASGQYYAFNGVTGSLLLTSIVSSTVITLQNIDATAGSAIASSTKIVPTGRKGDTGAGGDMYKSTYDTDNTGVVDDAQKLDNQLPSYYLDRSNQTGTQLPNTIANLDEAIDDRVAGLLVAGANITLTYNDVGNTLTIASTASGGGLSAWVTKTSNYTAVNGDRLRIDCSAGNVTILLPSAPGAFEIEIQRIDTSVNSLILDPNGKNFKGVAGKDGLFNNGNIGLSERISYINNAIGYLPQHDRLTYQTHTSSPSNLTYVSDGDTNGLFYWLGTNKGTTSWSNPFPQLTYSRSGSGVYDNFPTMTDRAINAHPNNTWLESSPYIQVDLGAGNAISPNYVSIRSWINTDRLPRNFKIQGSNNGTTFTDLLTVTNNTTITGMAQWLSLPISGSTAYRYLRYTAVSPGDSNNVVEIALGEWEFYGTTAFA